MFTVQENIHEINKIRYKSEYSMTIIQNKLEKKRRGKYAKIFIAVISERTDYGICILPYHYFLKIKPNLKYRCHLACLLALFLATGIELTT